MNCKCSMRTKLVGDGCEVCNPERAKDYEQITDGFGSYWSKTCPQCGQDTMEVVRAGKAQCGVCG